MTAAPAEIRRAARDAAGMGVHAARLLRHVLRRPFCSDFRLLARLSPAPGQVFVDAGAFQGDAVEAMRLYHPDTPIHAFEPNPGRARALAERFGADEALTIYQCALAGGEADGVLAAPVRGGRLVDSQASLDGRRAAHWDQVRWLETKLFALDALELDVSVLKIAVNGLEVSVLEGARETLHRCEPLVMCAPDRAADAFLTDELGWMRAVFDGARLIPGRAGVRRTIYAGPACEAALWRAGLLA